MDKNGDKDGKDHPKLELPPELVGVLANLNDGVGKLITGFGEMSAKLEGMSPQPKPKSTMIKDELDADPRLAKLEHLDRAEFMAFLEERIGKRIGNILEEKLSGFTKDKEENDEVRQREDMQKEINEFKKSHKDLEDWREELLAKFKESPSLSLNDAYSLVRQANPNKAKQLDEKYEVGEFAPERILEKEKAAEAKKRSEATSLDEIYGGLTPTSGKEPKDGEQKTLEDAGEAAWQAVVGGLDKLT